MKKLLSVFLILVMIAFSAINTHAEHQNYSEYVQIVRNAYYEAINAEGDSDVLYNEVYEIIHDLKKALAAGDTEERDYARVKLFGWSDKSSDEELNMRADQLLSFIVDHSGDKLSALMQKFSTMESVSGIIEPTHVEIAVNDMQAFINEFNLCASTSGYVLAILDLYTLFDEAVIFTNSGFRFEWTSIGAYQLNLQTSSVEDLARGSKGNNVILLQNRLNELGYNVGTADGDYGKKTAMAVAAFQKRNGLEATGIADIRTQELLYSNAALATHFGISIEEFIDLFCKTSDEDYVIKKEGSSYNIYWLGFTEIGSTFTFKTNEIGKVTSISFNGTNLSKHGSNQVYACLYAFGAINPEIRKNDLIDEFKKVCGTGKIETVNGIEYTYLESHTLNTLWFTIEINV